MKVVAFIRVLKEQQQGFLYSTCCLCFNACLALKAQVSSCLFKKNVFYIVIAYVETLTVSLHLSVIAAFLFFWYALVSYRKASF